MIKNRTAWSQGVHLFLADVTKVYDSVPVVKLWEFLEKSIINVTIISFIETQFKSIINSQVASR